MQHIHMRQLLRLCIYLNTLDGYLSNFTIQVLVCIRVDEIDGHSKVMLRKKIELEASLECCLIVLHITVTDQEN